MAKKKAGSVNKSQAIRDFRRTHPNHKPKQISAELSKKGIQVTPQFVSTILSTSKKKKSIGKPGRPKGSRNKAAGRATVKSGEAVSYDSLLKVKKIVSEMGGIDDARDALTALEKLMD